MRFLCLHGMGTNSKVFEMQTAAIRYALGPEHTYEYLDGAYPAPPAPGLETLLSASTITPAQYALPTTSDAGTSSRAALAALGTHISREGPYDGLMAFSQGAGLAASYLIQETRAGRQPVRVGIFFSGGVPVDPASVGADAGGTGERLMSGEVDGEVIAIPTAHVWGARDEVYPTFGPVLRGLCREERRSEFVHGGGHEIPGGKDGEGVRGAVRVVKRALMRAEEEEEVEGV